GTPFAARLPSALGPAAVGRTAPDHAALLWLHARGRGLNALLMGDETAAGLGVDVTRLRRELFTVTSVLTGVLVAVSGAIAFVALMVPHACRPVAGGDHRRLSTGICAPSRAVSCRPAATSASLLRPARPAMWRRCRRSGAANSS
ncbi:iron chelate uptake ABC transporter family permease subunit, partial [Streptomyces wuyuanensis]|uniref:iron chelate uptake ABC transporter family permease subunit n=1 Tax=Streptomyces wuyuanensis TaxID=1196353 RepID=UPI0037F62C4C